MNRVAARLRQSNKPRRSKGYPMWPSSSDHRLKNSPLRPTTRNSEACMSRPQTWFLLAMATMLTGSLSGMVLAGGDAKAGPKPLPPDVVKAWQNKGAEVVWMRRLDWGVLGAFPENERGAGSLPAFGFPGPRYRA